MFKKFFDGDPEEITENNFYDAIASLGTNYEEFPDWYDNTNRYGFIELADNLRIYGVPLKAIYTTLLSAYCYTMFEVEESFYQDDFGYVKE